jgi:4-amino-4-deoxy-L-arabinose transferase-like glycosyltransferase
MKGSRLTWPESAWFAALCMGAWLAATAWLRPLMLPDEGRYVGVAWEMMYSGDWLTPTLNGLPFFHKPPLFYWITAASMSVGGLNEWAARAAPMLGAWLGALSVYALVRRWVDERRARLTVAALMVQPLFYIGAQFANLDMLVAGCITATIAALAHAALCMAQSLPYRRVLAGAYALAALGVLAKGLIGVVLPAMVITAWLWSMRRWRDWFQLLWWPGMALFFLLASPWFVLMQERFPQFLNYFFVVQHFKRFAQTGFNNVQPFWFYPVALIAFSAPGLAWLYRSARHSGQDDGVQKSLRGLMWLWTAVVVLFFSLPQSKIIGYVLPVVPALAYLMVDGLLASGDPSPKRQRWWMVSLGASAAIGLVVVITLAIKPMRSGRPLAQALQAPMPAGSGVMMLHRYDYDLAFYAHSTAPATVVDDWHAVGTNARDDWRKELADAQPFANTARRLALITPQQVNQRLCAQPLTWVIGEPADAKWYPVLETAHVAYAKGNTLVWRVDLSRPEVTRSLQCAEKPNVD